MSRNSDDYKPSLGNPTSDASAMLEDTMRLSISGLAFALCLLVEEDIRVNRSSNKLRRPKKTNNTSSVLHKHNPLQHETDREEKKCKETLEALQHEVAGELFGAYVAADAKCRKKAETDAYEDEKLKELNRRLASSLEGLGKIIEEMPVFESHRRSHDTAQGSN